MPEHGLALHSHRGTRAIQRLVEFAPSTGGLALWVTHHDDDRCRRTAGRHRRPMHPLRRRIRGLDCRGAGRTGGPRGAAHRAASPAALPGAAASAGRRRSAAVQHLRRCHRQQRARPPGLADIAAARRVAGAAAGQRAATHGRCGQCLAAVGCGAAVPRHRRPEPAARHARRRWAVAARCGRRDGHAPVAGHRLGSGGTEAGARGWRPTGSMDRLLLARANSALATRAIWCPAPRVRTRPKTKPRRHASGANACNVRMPATASIRCCARCWPICRAAARPGSSGCARNSRARCRRSAACHGHAHRARTWPTRGARAATGACPSNPASAPRGACRGWWWWSMSRARLPTN